MLKQGQYQKMLQKLSPQQIQLIKLLQVPTDSLEERIKEELETNPALEEGLTEDDNEEEAKLSENDGDEAPKDETEKVEQDEVAEEPSDTAEEEPKIEDEEREEVEDDFTFS